MKKIATIATASVLSLCAVSISARAADINDIEDPAFLTEVALGQSLFFDKILSGNRNTSCASCHHPLTDTGDGLSLPIGEGGKGLGVLRDTGRGRDSVHERVPRNAPHLFNLAMPGLTNLFYDGRVEIDETAASGFSSPAGEALPFGLNNVVAVQAMFPVTSTTEMAGQFGENSIANAAEAGDVERVWQQLAHRLQRNHEYVALFKAAYPDEIQQASDITFVHAANAIATFEQFAWRADNSPFDQFQVDTDRGANPEANQSLSPNALRGMAVFQQKCGFCHAGEFQTDMRFHAIAMPQIGPGKGSNQEGYTDGHDDFGREAVTGNPIDRFKFRTPSLRNVELTAPYGHAGAYATLENMVRHYTDPVGSLKNYNQSQAILPSRRDLDEHDFVVMDDPNRLVSIAEANVVRPVPGTPIQLLTDEEVDDVLAFLHALTDPDTINTSGLVPASVPSGLPVNE